MPRKPTRNGAKRQPIQKIGRIAAETVLCCISRREVNRNSKQIIVEPELTVRETTAALAEQQKAYR